MVIGAIFAGGIGSRMGSADMPKQYLQLGSKPIIVHTIEKFVVNPGIDRIIVLCPKAWIAHTKDLVKKYLSEAIAEKINVVEGGSTRNGTLENALKFINENFAIDDDSVIVTHDAVRPFVTHRIIDENIEAAKKYGACDTVIPATDTIVRSEDSENVSSDQKRAVSGSDSAVLQNKGTRERSQQPHRGREEHADRRVQDLYNKEQARPHR